MINRRDFLGRALGVSALAVVAPRLLRAEAAPIPITVYKSPTCGCCKVWIRHMQANGFAVKVIDMDDVTPMKRTAGVPPSMESCHTALAGKYVVEGHVPADIVKMALEKNLAVRGFSVPGMPLGAPGMEESGGPQPYTVMSWTADGKTKVFAKRG